MVLLRLRAIERSLIIHVCGVELGGTSPRGFKYNEGGNQNLNDNHSFLILAVGLAPTGEDGDEKKGKGN